MPCYFNFSHIKRPSMNSRIGINFSHIKRPRRFLWIPVLYFYFDYFIIGLFLCYFYIIFWCCSSLIIFLINVVHIFFWAENLLKIIYLPSQNRNKVVQTKLCRLRIIAGVVVHILKYQDFSLLPIRTPSRHSSTPNLLNHILCNFSLSLPPT